MEQQTTTMDGHAPVSAALDLAYHVLEGAIARRIADNRAPLFTTAVAPDALWLAYLGAIPAELRAHYTCNSCRHFLQRYGGLVTIDDAGFTAPFLWDGLDVPEAIRPIVDVLARIVGANRVDGVFRWADAPWGTPSNVAPKTGVTWTHLHGHPGVHHERRGETPEQQMAALREDVGILSRSLDDYSQAAANEAVRVLRSGALTRSEKAEGVAVWFADLWQRIAAAPRRRRTLVWRAVATAPPGYAHIRTTVLSTLLDDIVGGLSFDEVSRRWAEKLHPLQYQRPTAPATSGQIDAAERKVKLLGVERSLSRRYATLADVLATLWAPRAEPVRPGVPDGGVFGALRQETAAVAPLELPAQPMTWEKFTRAVLPTAFALEARAPSRGAFYGLVTASDPEAPAIIQWDGLAGHPRNPVSWYFYHGGSTASQWGLAAGWVPVTAVFLGPPQWQEPTRFAHQGRRAFFALAGARDSRDADLALFPEILQAEFREIRTVIEAFNRRTTISGREEGNANGLAFDGQTKLRVRVKTTAGLSVYDLDRWE